MAANLSVIVIGGPALGVIFVLLLVLVLIQCGDAKKKDNKDLDNEDLQTEGPYEKVAPLVTPEQKINGLKPEDCTVTVQIDPSDDGNKSSTLKSNASSSIEIGDRPKQPTPLLPRNSKDCESAHLVNSQGKSTMAENIDNVQASNEVAKSKSASLPRQNQPVSNGSQKQSSKIVEGSYETSGSGEELYTKVKPAETKPECAYSVVEIADKETKYEMIDGKLTRTSYKKNVATENVPKSEYEVFDMNKQQDLDPVLFAVEDSGASGIYEAVSDSQKENPTIAGSQVKTDSTDGKEKTHESGEDNHDEPKKKWGLTRFSLIKRNKTKTQKEKLHPESPAERRKSNLKGSNENLTKLETESHKDQVIEGHRRTASGRGELLPPLPPMENLRLKVEKRRTYHEGDLIVAQPSGEQAKRPPAAVPNLYTSDNAGNTEDAVYEIPDRGIVSAKISPTQQVSPKWRSDSASSPRMAHREVPKPPKPDVAPTFPADGDVEENYECISSETVLSNEISSRRTDESKDPKYAKVKKKEVTEPNGGEKGKEEEAQKIEVFIRRTTISTNAKRTCNGEKDEESDTNAGDSLMPEGAPFLAETKEDIVDEKPTNIEDLYAKVDLNRKRDDAAKRALYATVNKEKTGVKKFYYDDDVVEIKNEYEDGHYTKIEETEDPSEEIDEQKNMAMFQAIRPLTKNEKKSRKQPPADDYEDITVNESTGQTNQDKGNEYETIVVEKSSQKRVQTDEYEEIGECSMKARTVNHSAAVKQQKLYKRNEDDYLDINDFPDGSKNNSFDVHL
eukprot:gene8375-14349_t